MKLVVMVLLGFEVLMILTKRKSIIADWRICADIFSRSPVVVHAACGRFDFLYFGLMTALYHYFYNHDKNGCER